MEKNVRRAVIKSAGLVSDAKSCVIRIQQALNSQSAREPRSGEEVDFLEVEQVLLGVKQGLQLLDRSLAKLL